MLKTMVKNERCIFELFLSAIKHMNALTTRDLVYTTDLEESEAFFRKNWEEAEEELRFEPCISIIKVPKMSSHNVFGGYAITHIYIHGCNTIRITTESGEMDEIDIIRILNMEFYNLKGPIILLRLFHLGCVDISCNEVVIKLPICIAKNATFYAKSLSDDYTIELSKSSVYTLDDEYNHDTTWTLWMQHITLNMGHSIYTNNSLYNLIIYITKIDEYIHTNEEVDHENIPLRLSIYRGSDNVLLAVIPYDELNVSESYNITCYKCNLTKFVGKYIGRIRIDMPNTPAFRTYAYGEWLDD